MAAWTNGKVFATNGPRATGPLTTEVARRRPADRTPRCCCSSLLLYFCRWWRCFWEVVTPLSTLWRSFLRLDICASCRWYACCVYQERWWPEEMNGGALWTLDEWMDGWTHSVLFIVPRFHFWWLENNGKEAGKELSRRWKRKTVAVLTAAATTAVRIACDLLKLSAFNSNERALPRMPYIRKWTPAYKIRS